MKTIFLKSISLRNFKGIKKMDLEFTEMESSIHGANASGKTTVFDAFTWVLFGKDSTDRKDFNIKTLKPDGSNTEKLEHEVKAVLSVDGKAVTLHRIYKENWVKKRGEEVAELKGHETLFYINEVPKKAGEYASEISEIVEEGVFKLITNPQYFPAMKWQDQREILFRIAGTVSDQEIANGNKSFEKLLEKLDGKKLSDYKTQISSTKRKLKTDLEAIPTRIDEAENAKPEAFDFDLIEAEIKDKQSEASNIDKSISDANFAQSQVFEKNKKIYEDINEIRKEQQQIIAKKQQKLYDEDAETRAEKSNLESQIRTYENEIEKQKNRHENNLFKIESIEKTLSELRNTWDEENSKTYKAESGQLVCPVWNIACGDPKSLELHQENQDKARQTFNTKKAEKLAQINAEGKGLNLKISELKEQNNDVVNDLETMQNEKSELQKRLAIYPSESMTVRQIVPSSIQDWSDLERKAAALESSLILQVTAESGNEALAEARTQITSEITELQKKLSHRAIIENQEKRIEQLNEELKKVAQQISDLEKDEFTLEAFTKAKIDEAESRINSRFSFVKFKLFDRQINGADVETCQAMVNGVPYSDANTAAKINAGLDIINVLCDFNDVTAPVFVDNRESVSEIIDTKSQIINLVVNPDYKKLTLK